MLITICHTYSKVFSLREEGVEHILQLEAIDEGLTLELGVEE